VSKYINNLNFLYKTKNLFLFFTYSRSLHFIKLRVYEFYSVDNSNLDTGK